ncbi:MAG TPA: hypothetical protein VF607_09705 [Verrucomicrobiae bacterium]
MRRFRNSFFALVALLWLPASAHCVLEQVPGLSFLKCEVAAADHTTKGDGCGGCCTVEQSHYRSEIAPLQVPTAAGLIIPCPPLAATQSPVPAEVRQGILTAAPPLCSSSRHFLVRTALPVRAPAC